MSRTVNLVLRVDSDGYAVARERMRALREEGPAVEQAMDRLAQRSDRTSERQAAAAERAAQKQAQAEERKAEAAERAAQKAAAAAERAYEKEFAALVRKEEREAAAIARQVSRQEQAAQRAAQAAERAAARESSSWNEQIQRAKARYDRQAEAAERAAQRQAASAERAARREAEAWNDQIQKIKARLEHEGIGRDGVLPIRPSLQRIESKLNESSIGGGILQGAGLSVLAGGAAGIAASVTGAVIGGAKDFAGDLLRVTREFDKLNASLLTVTGSSKEAGRVFAVLQDFAAKTPYNLEQSVNAFVQLKNLGLDATERSLKAFGDMAAAFGDSMDHMLLAVGDSVMGINRPLKQFGINAEDASSKSKKFGAEVETVKYSFRGHTTEVEKSAKAIQDYLIKLSEENFSTAMTNRLHTLDGQLSNVEDNWHRFELAIMQSGLEDSLTGVASKLAEILQTMSGLAKKYTKPAIEGIKIGVRGGIGSIPIAGGLANAAIDSYHPGMLITDDMLNAETDRLAKHAADVSKLNADKQAEEYRSLVASLKTRRELLDEWHKKARDTALAQMNEYDSATDQRVSSDIDKIEKKYRADLAALDKKEGAAGRRAAKQYERDLQAEDPLYKASQEFERRQKEIDKFEKSGSDAWERWTNANLDKYAKDVANFHASQNQKLEAVRKELRDQEETIAQAYARRKYIIEKNSVGQDKADLLQDLERKREAETIAFYAKKAAAAKASTDEDERQRRAQVEFEQRVRSFGKEPSQIEMLNRKYAGQRFDLAELLRDKIKGDVGDPFQTDAQLKAQELFKQKSIDIEKERLRELAALRVQMVQDSLQSSQAMFGSFAAAARNWGGEQSAIYRTMFAAQKAFAVASATTSMAVGIGKAMELGWPAGIPAAIGAAAEGAKILAMISSSNYSGAYDRGGDIPAGKVGLVGERRLEMIDRPTFVRGPAHVIGGSETSQMLGGSGGRPQINITVLNAPEGRANAYRASSAREQVVVSDTRRARGAMQRAIG